MARDRSRLRAAMAGVGSAPPGRTGVPSTNGHRPGGLVALADRAEPPADRQDRAGDVGEQPGQGTSSAAGLGRRATRGGFLAAAAALVVLAGVAVVLARGTGSSGGEAPAVGLGGVGEDAGPGQDEGSGPASGQDLTCGGDLPVDVPVPAGYSGPQDGPAESRLSDPVEGQLVRSWTGAGTEVEVRWPADEPEVPETRDQGAGGEASLATTSVAVSEPLTTADGDVAFRSAVSSPGLGEDACQVMQVVVSGADEAQVRQAASDLHAALFATGGPFGPADDPLVAGTATLAAEPDVTPCPDSDEAYRGGPVGGLGTFATAAEALEAFLASRTTLEEDAFGVEQPVNPFLQTGYIEASLPDGSVVFTNTVDDQVIMAVHATQAADGWTVDRFTASGC